MKICVSLDEFMRISVGWIYCLVPDYKPRFIDEILDDIVNNFKTNCKSIGNDFFYHEIELKDLYKFIENILMPIDKFRELNLSQNEYEKGVKVDDEDRPKVQFISTFSTIPEKDNFVDLDACIQDIFSSYEHRYFYEWAYGEMDIDKLNQFRQEYRNLGADTTRDCKTCGHSNDGKCAGTEECHDCMWMNNYIKADKESEE